MLPGTISVRNQDRDRTNLLLDDKDPTNSRQIQLICFADLWNEHTLIYELT
jgi:hypothetical protein